MIQIPQTPSLSKQERQRQGMDTQRKQRTWPEGIMESSPWQPQEWLILDKDQTLLTVHKVVTVDVTTSYIDFLNIDPDWSRKTHDISNFLTVDPDKLTSINETDFKIASHITLINTYLGMNPLRITPLHTDNKVSDWYIYRVVSPCFNMKNWSCLVNTKNNNVLVPENLVLNLSPLQLTPTQISVLGRGLTIQSYPRWTWHGESFLRFREIFQNNET